VALKVTDHFKPHGMMNGKPFPIWSVAKASGTTWLEGAVIIDGGAGLAVEGADNPTKGTILGVAQCPAFDGDTSALIIPALPGVIFSGCVATGVAGADYTLQITDRFSLFGVALEAGSTGTWYVNENETTVLAVLITDFIDDVGDNLARVAFTFIDSDLGGHSLN